MSTFNIKEISSDYKYLHSLAFLCNASYIVDVNEFSKQVEAVGFSFVSLVHNGSGGTDQGNSQAYLCQKGDIQYVIWRGTQFKENCSLTELFNDIELIRRYYWYDTFAAKGFSNCVESISSQILRMLKINKNIVNIGHSKGGSECHIFRMCLPLDTNILTVSFGAPACVCPKFGEEMYGPGVPNLLRVVAGHDFAPEWGTFASYVHPNKEYLWLSDEGPKFISQNRPGLDCSIQDHDIENSYMKKLGNLVK